jgi:chorismate synthase
MNSNTIGKQFSLTSFGESHGEAIGGVIDGCPANLKLDFAFINKELKKRSTGQSHLVSPRHEKDEVEFLSGLFNGVTTGTPIAFIVRNSDCDSNSYETMKDIYRPSHADYVYQQKYGIRDWRGGGRASARCTLPVVVAGAIAKQILLSYNISIQAYVAAIGNISMSNCSVFSEAAIESSPVRCPDLNISHQMENLLEKLQQEGDTIGGIVHSVIKNLTVGLGEPLFDKFQARLAEAIFSINAVKGFEYGDGFSAAKMKGSECNDAFVLKNGKIGTVTNHSGGIQGGITNGEDVVFNVAFKPIPTLMKEIQVINADGNSSSLKPSGRYDVCAVPRAVVIVEAMAALVTLDHLLISNIYKDIAI